MLSLRSLSRAVWFVYFSLVRQYVQTTMVDIVRDKRNSLVPKPGRTLSTWNVVVRKDTNIRVQNSAMPKRRRGIPRGK